MKEATSFSFVSHRSLLRQNQKGVSTKQYKMYNITTFGGEAYVCLNNNRIKQTDTVYLQNHQPFQLELYNPTQKNLLAKITMNGTLISQAGLVLHPGQRVYLERFLDIDRKFVFETYDVDHTPQTAEAIALNGNIKVDFYEEYTPPKAYEPVYTNQVYFMSGGCGSLTTTDGTVTVNNAGTTVGCSGGDVSYRSSVTLDTPLKETGRIEQGGRSKQKFTNFNGEFNTYTLNTVNIKILPISQKPLQVSDLITYCTNCGTRNRRNKYKYCPKCGQKF